MANNKKVVGDRWSVFENGSMKTASVKIASLTLAMTIYRMSTYLSLSPELGVVIL
jgi:hypothetical protein